VCIKGSLQYCRRHLKPRNGYTHAQSYTECNQSSRVHESVLSLSSTVSSALHTYTHTFTSVPTYGVYIYIVYMVIFFYCYIYSETRGGKDFNFSIYCVFSVPRQTNAHTRAHSPGLNFHSDPAGRHLPLRCQRRLQRLLRRRLRR